MTYTTGSTIIITATYSADLDYPPKVSLINSKQQILTSSTASRTDTGIYTVYLTLPTTEGMYTYEFIGSSQGYPVISRGNVICSLTGQ